MQGCRYLPLRGTGHFETHSESGLRVTFARRLSYVPPDVQLTWFWISMEEDDNRCPKNVFIDQWCLYSRR
jgi:hypothetical protein